MNEDLKDVHDRLLAQHAALAAKLDEESDPANIKAILMEMREVLHRIDLIQNLLFTATSKALEKAVANVQTADDKLSRAIKKAGDMADILKATGEFLKVVDQAIDIAKTLAIL